MRLSARTPRRVVNRVLWALASHGFPISYHLGGKRTAALFLRMFPLDWMSRESLAHAKRHGVSGA